MPRWAVRLEGQPRDLQELTAALNDPYARVVQDGGQFFLESEQFDLFDDAAEVLSSARAMVGWLNGLAKVRSSTAQSVRAGAVRLSEQGRPTQHFVFAEVAAVLAVARVEATGTVARPDGIVEESPFENVMIARLKQAAASADVAKALRLFGNGDRNFAELYKTFEVVRKGIGGEAVLRGTGWMSKRELDRFTRTAQHPDVLGDKARHGYIAQPPPSDPMTLEEGRAFIAMLLERWLSTTT